MLISRNPVGRVRASRSRRRAIPTLVIAATAGLVLGACTAPDSDSRSAESLPWSEVEEQARGQTVSLWMYGGDEQGNAYVDDVLAPAAADEGITLRRVPVESTTDAVNRILTERQAGVTDGEVDLVWVNGANFGTGKQAGAWLCDWTQNLPNMQYTDPDDSLLNNDFGTPVDRCESPWHKAQFTLVYNADAIEAPPSTFEEVLEWAQANPGRFTYPAPPDFTGSVFIREALVSTSGGIDKVPAQFDRETYDRLAPVLFDRLNELAPSLWREGTTYPQSSAELDDLYAGGQLDMTMTYGPATLPELVSGGTFPPNTRVLTLDEGTVGNASFLAIPSTSGQSAAAQMVANLALSPEQQLIKSRPDVWGQFTVLDLERLTPDYRQQFEGIPASPVVPSYQELSAGAHPELSAEWVTPLDEGWRRNVLAGQ